jgi:hypothetical protein
MIVALRRWDEGSLDEREAIISEMTDLPAGTGFPAPDKCPCQQALSPFFQADLPFLSVNCSEPTKIMADDTRDRDTVSTATPGAGAGPVPPKRIPKGVVLGKDGKP